MEEGLSLASGADFRPFAHVNAVNASVYRQIMSAFVRAKQRFIVHLRPEDIHEVLGSDITAINNALTSLVEWGNLRADPDTARVTTVEDFHRARFLYQLTLAGEAAEQALTTYDEALGRRGALQAVALTDIATQLKALLELARQADPDPVKAHLLLRGLVDRFTDLADNAQAFMSSLQRTIDLHDVDVDAFAAYKDQLIDYLERFIKDLVGTGAEIARLVEEVEQTSVDRLLDLAADREAQDTAPGADDPRRQAYERGRVLWRERWRGFRGWFVHEPHHPSQARLLRARARSAIPQLLQVVTALNERRSGRSDRSTDFRTLARWFAQAPTDADLPRLWRAAFGLSASRHLMVDDDSSRQATPSGTPWAAATPLNISPQLRKTGSYERRGKPNRVIDRSTERRHLAEFAAQQAAELASARQLLATDHPTRLNDLGTLDPAAFQLFLALLGDALAALAPGRRAVTATTSDGSMAIRLTVLDDQRTANIRTPGGVFSGPDHLVHILDLTTDEREERSA